MAKYWKLGIIGWPLGYSLSPLIHTRALAHVGFEGEYREYPVQPTELPRWLDQLVELKLDGFNVTMPFKRQVRDWVMKTGRLGFPDRDGAVGAVNTVVMDSGRPIGYNTDGEGFLRALTDPPRSMNLRGWYVILLGAGGTAEAIAVTLALETRVSSLTIWNRDLSRAKQLAAKVNSLASGRDGNFADVVERHESLLVRDCQLLVNATPVGMRGHERPLIDPKDLHEGQIVYDIVYEPRQTPLIQAASERGCQVITGDEMLAGQGAAAFEIWTGVKGTFPIMRQALDERFAGSV